MPKPKNSSAKPKSGFGAGAICFKRTRRDKRYRPSEPYPTPLPDIKQGRYSLKTDGKSLPLRPNTALGEWCISHAKAQSADVAEIVFDYSSHRDKISDMQARHGQSGWLRLDKLTVKSEAAATETLVFTAFTDSGDTLDDDFCRHLLSLSGSLKAKATPPARLKTLAQNHLAQAQVQ